MLHSGAVVAPVVFAATGLEDPDNGHLVVVNARPKHLTFELIESGERESDFDRFFDLAAKKIVKFDRGRRPKETVNGPQHRGFTGTISPDNRHLAPNIDRDLAD
jgi:hypothetical protein